MAKRRCSWPGQTFARLRSVLNSIYIYIYIYIHTHAHTYMYILCGFCTIKAPHRTTTTTVQQRQNHRWCRRRLSHLPFAKRFHSSSDTPVLSIGAPSPLPPHQGIPRLDASFSSPQCRWPVHCQNIGVDRIG